MTVVPKAVFKLPTTSKVEHGVYTCTENVPAFMNTSSRVQNSAKITSRDHAAPHPAVPENLRHLYLTDEPLKPLYETIADCPNCELAKQRSQTVPGSGPITADLMFVGEAPGQREDEWGLPFVGRSGQFLDKLLSSIGLTRADVYVTNIVKCRPPKNRDPKEREITSCSDFLDQQVSLINPVVIATLGRFSMARWFPDARISRIHGQVKRIGCRYVVPMYHPAAALRNNNLRSVMHDDFEKLLPLLREHSASNPIDSAPSPVKSEHPRTYPL